MRSIVFLLLSVSCVLVGMEEAEQREAACGDFDTRCTIAGLKLFRGKETGNVFLKVKFNNLRGSFQSNAAIYSFDKKERFSDYATGTQKITQEDIFWGQGRANCIGIILPEKTLEVWFDQTKICWKITSKEKWPE